MSQKENLGGNVAFPNTVVSQKENLGGSVVFPNTAVSQKENLGVMLLFQIQLCHRRTSG